MRVNTRKFLEVYDLKDIGHAYTLAYLQNKGVTIKNNVPVIDKKNQWSYGNFGEGQLLRSEQNAIFSLVTAPEMTADNESTEGQVVGSNLQERYTAIIAHFIASGYEKLPQKNISIAFCINHNDTHWTMLLAKFQNIDQKAYTKLYKDYHNYLKQSKEDVDEEGQQKEFHVRSLYVRNYLQKTQKMILTHQEDQERVLSNWVLPVNAKKITLTHYDSLGQHSNDATMVDDACEDFVAKHKATFTYEKSKIQTGSTCGDWSVYNAFNLGVLKKGKTVKQQPSSNDLRTLAVHVSLKNANEILYAKKPKLTKPAVKDRICITKDARALVEQTWNEDEDADEDANEDENEVQDENEIPGEKNKGKNKKKDRKEHQENRQPATGNNKKKSKFEMNEAYPVVNLLGRTSFAAMGGYLCFLILAPTVLTFQPLWFMTLSGLASASFLFNIVSEGIFGKTELSYVVQKNKELMIKSERHSHGLAKLLGYNVPYHQTLEELENSLSTQIADKTNNKLLTHYYAKKIVLANPECFYTNDKSIVTKNDYVNESQAKRLLKITG